MDILTDGLLKCRIPEQCVNGLAQKMEAYIKEIILFNSAYNLTNTSDHDELVTRHILDSLSAFKVIYKLAAEAATTNVNAPSMPHTDTTIPAAIAAAGAYTTAQASATPPVYPVLHIADIGSGGGLPGIPLAAAFLLAGNISASGTTLENALSTAQFFLVERMEKRCAFLENCKAILGLSNVTVINSEVERLEENQFDLITFRAFRPLDKKMTKSLLRIVKDGGKLCAYKAKMENITQEMDGIKNLVKNYSIEKLTVPGLQDSERNLVIISR